MDTMLLRLLPWLFKVAWTKGRGVFTGVSNIAFNWASQMLLLGDFTGSLNTKGDSRATLDFLSLLNCNSLQTISGESLESSGLLSDEFEVLVFSFLGELARRLNLTADGIFSFSRSPSLRISSFNSVVCLVLLTLVALFLAIIPCGSVFTYVESVLFS